MIDRDSRYARSAVLHLTDAEGREIAYLDRRIIPDDPRIAARIAVQDGDRLELYRSLTVDPKLARRQRFASQGARAAGLFARRRPGGKQGY